MPILQPKVFIIILNWNGKEDTLACLNSLKKSTYSNQEIVVVDNGSCDDSVEQIKALYPSVIVLETGENLGYAEGNNVGLRYVLGLASDYVFIINNDTIVSENCVDELIDTAIKMPNAGILSPLVMYYDEPEVIWYAGTLLEKINYNFSRDSDGINIDSFDRKYPYKTITGAGCALMMPSKTLREIGLLHKDYFLYWEEMDLSYRMVKASYDIVVVPTAKMWHKIGSSFDLHKEDASKVKVYFWQRNRLLWAKRNLTSLAKWKIYFLSLISLLPKIHFNRNNNYPIHKSVYWSLQEVLNVFSDSVYRAKLLGAFHFVLGRFGDCPESLKMSIKNTR
ncbi:MAG: glycosyltransferase family 2 protein [Methylococcales bacterium]